MMDPMALCELRYFSKSLGMQTAANVILPSHDVPGPWAVMFLLHGLSDDCSIWLRRTSIERYVEGMPLIVVMPDGGRGFYADAEQGFAYRTAIGEELVEIVKGYFPTGDKWCATGLSMGGYGAFRLALDRPDLFRSAVSHSGALHFGHLEAVEENDFTREFRRVLGSSPKGGPNDLHALATRLKPEEMPALRFDCGTEDSLLDANREFHRHLAENGIDHEYEEFPGDHNWAYWDEHVQRALAFHRAKLGF